MDAQHFELVLCHQRLRLRQQLVPDAEAAVRPAHVGLARAAAAQARVEAQADAAARERRAKRIQLVQAADSKTRVSAQTKHVMPATRVQRVRARLQALSCTPARMSSGKKSGSSCDDSEICAHAAQHARRTGARQQRAGG
jgi:hypothetical protein